MKKNILKAWLGKNELTPYRNDFTALTCLLERHGSE
jgi:hypothetical protein